MAIPAPLYQPAPYNPAAAANGTPRTGTSLFSNEDISSVLGLTPTPQAPAAPAQQQQGASYPSSFPFTKLPDTPTPQGPSQGMKTAAGGLAGISAAPAPAQSPDATSAAINIGEGTASGAAAGFAAGGPWGALAGAGIGALTSSLNAWLGVRNARKSHRERARIIAEAEAKEKKRLNQERNDAIGQENYNRSEVRKAQLYQVYQDQQKQLADLFLKNDAAKNKYVQDGWVR